MKIVWAELDENQQAIRIFKNKKSMVFAMPYYEDGWCKEMSKVEAVGQIRRKVYDRQSGKCIECGKEVPWDGDIFKRAHMHEIIPKGQGGEVSVTNCEILCYACHIDGKHGNRKPQFGKSVNE